MRLIIENSNPSIVILEDFKDNLGSIKESLSYRDTSAIYLLNKFKNNPKMAQWMDEDEYSARLTELKKNAELKCLLFEEDGVFYTYSGLAPFLAKKLNLQIDNRVQYPKFNKLAWANEPKYSPYDYQIESKEKLLEIKHGGVELATGLGKSYIIQMLVREIGQKTIIMTPSTNISEQLYLACVNLFGKSKVGRFFGSKKESSKLIVIANGQSLTRLEPDSEHFKELSQTKVFIADECHTTPAKTFEKVCLGVAQLAPYRFFFSATQMRNDGKDLLLEGITGTLVKHMALKDGVDGGYLAKPHFVVIKTHSDDPSQSTDPAVLNRKHLYYNANVAEIIGGIVNTAIEQSQPVLVLIEEVEQFTKLLPFIKTNNVGFAHGPLVDNKSKVPEQYWESDVDQLVEDFNKNKLAVLIGTSCISTGTDIQTTKVLVYWQGGKSEIQVTQAVGRGTRIAGGKKNFMVFDFEIDNIPTIKKQAQVRARIYNELYGPVTYKEVL
jgi:superfamily II DNA or RNA helicase